MSFLTNENGQFILELLQRFLTDAYQFKLQSVMTELQLRKLLETTMVSIYKKNDKTTPLEQLNKMTIVELKEYIKKTFIQKPEEPVPIPLSEDSDFTNKVQMLEFQRKNFQMPAVSPILPNGTSMSPTPQSNPVIPTSTPQPNPVIPPSIPTSVSTVYMPMPPKIGKEILISSIVRDGQRFVENAQFEWNGPFQHTSDSLTRVVGILGKFKEMYLRVFIQGAGGETEQVTLVFDGYMYRPLLNTLGYMRRLSLPWKISLCSVNGDLLNVGKGYRYTFEKTKEGTVLTLNELIVLQESTVWICMDNRTYQRGTIHKIDEKKIWILETLSHEGYVFKDSEQYTLVLEMTTSEHRPITRS